MSLCQVIWLFLFASVSVSSALIVCVFVRWFDCFCHCLCFRCFDCVCFFLSMSLCQVIWLFLFINVSMSGDLIFCFCLSVSLCQVVWLLMSVCQVPFSAADLGAKRDCVTGNVLLLHSDGVVQSFRVADSKQRSDIGAYKMIFFLMVFFWRQKQTFLNLDLVSQGYWMKVLTETGQHCRVSFQAVINKVWLIIFFLSQKSMMAKKKNTMHHVYNFDMI